MISGLAASQIGFGLRIDLLSRSGGYYLSLGAESVPGFRLQKETMA